MSDVFDISFMKALEISIIKRKDFEQAQEIIQQRDSCHPAST